MFARKQGCSNQSMKATRGVNWFSQFTPVYLGFWEQPWIKCKTNVRKKVKTDVRQNVRLNARWKARKKANTRYNLRIKLDIYVRQNANAKSNARKKVTSKCQIDCQKRCLTNCQRISEIKQGGKRWEELRRGGKRWKVKRVRWGGEGLKKHENSWEELWEELRRAEMAWEELRSGGHSWKGVRQDQGDFPKQSFEEGFVPTPIGKPCLWILYCNIPCCGFYLQATSRNVSFFLRKRIATPVGRGCTSFSCPFLHAKAQCFFGHTPCMPEP